MVEWQENLAIGVLEIDIQHKLLFEKFNAFLEACHDTTEAESIQRLFWFLEAYAITHFTKEEELMQQVGYPDYLKHREEHAQFGAEITAMKERLQTEGPTAPLVSHIKMFISRWLLNHIIQMDRPLAPYVKEAGIPPIS